MVGWWFMARPLLPDDLWTEIVSLLPPPQPRPKGGRSPLDNRGALTGILFLLRSGLPWEMLPAEMGCGCGTSCWRRPSMPFRRCATAGADARANAPANCMPTRVASADEV